jgi:DNA-binding NarL/FixJ family response regulator
MFFRLLIIAADPLVRTGLAALLHNQPDVEIVGQSGPEADSLDALDIFQPDIALVDLGWEPVPMLDTLRQLVDAGLPVVALLPDAEAAPAVLATEVQGLLLRDAPPAQLLAALQAARQTLVTIDPRLIEALRPQQPPPATAALIEALTPRESEVLHLLAQGLPNKTIAQRLNISDHTVKFHVTAIMTKLEAQSRTEAVIRATQLGLVML